MLGSRILPLRFAVESRLEEVVYVKTIITDNSQFSNVLSYLTDEAATDKEGGIAIFDQGVCKAETFWNDPKEEVRQYVVENNFWPNAIAKYLEKPLLDALVELGFDNNKPVNACLYQEEYEYDQYLDSDQYVDSDNDAEFYGDEDPSIDPDVSSYQLERYCDDEEEAKKTAEILNGKYGIKLSIGNKKQAGANSLPLMFEVDSQNEFGKNGIREIVYLKQNFSPKLAPVVASLLSQNEIFSARGIEGEFLQRIRAKENFSLSEAQKKVKELNAKGLVLTYELIELDPTQKFIATCQNVLARLAKLAEPILNAQAVQQR